MVSVIIIDKVDILRRNMKRVLERAEDISVLGDTASPAEGVTLFTFHRPDVVVLEADLPNRMFWGALKEMREHGPESHIILVAGTQVTEVRQMAYHMGVSAVVQKPIDPEVLLATVSDVVNGRRPSFGEAEAKLSSSGQALAPTAVAIGTDAEGLSVLCSAVSMAGATVLERVDRFDQAVGVCRNTNPVLIALDLGGPDPAALDFLATLRGDGRPVKVVVAGGAADPATVRAIRELGADAYVLKPVQPAVLAARLAQVLAAPPKPESAPAPAANAAAAGT